MPRSWRPGRRDRAGAGSGALGVGEAPQVALAVDPFPGRFPIPISGGFGAQTLLAELGQARALRVVHQPRLLRRRRRGRIGHRHCLRARQLAGPHGVFHHRQPGQLGRGRQHVLGRRDTRARLGGQVLRRRRIPRPLPLLDFVHPSGQQRDGRGDLAVDALELVVEGNHCVAGMASGSKAPTNPVTSPSKSSQLSNICSMIARASRSGNNCSKLSAAPPSVQSARSTHCTSSRVIPSGPSKNRSRRLM